MTQKENSASRAPESNGGKHQIASPSLSLPKGGGAIRGMGEKFSANPVNGTGVHQIPVFTSPGRSDFYPKLSLTYDSGAGNGVFGLGWDIAVPCISRKTDRQLPQYRDEEESDTFILSGAEDLVPTLKKSGTQWIKDQHFSNGFFIQRYRPRIEGLFARIERWENIQTHEIHWKSITKENITSIYGGTAKARILDPSDPSRIFKWLLELSYDDKGNVIFYEYKKENSEGIDDSLPYEKNKINFTNCYLKRIRYGNKQPYQKGEPPFQIIFDNGDEDFLFEVVLDYGEHDPDNPSKAETMLWEVRPDPFSNFRAGFEIRTYRLCRRILMFHRFSELGAMPCLVRSTDIRYLKDIQPDHSLNPVLSLLKSVQQSGYIRVQETIQYSKKSFPSVDFEYTEREAHEEVRSIDEQSLENLPIGFDPTKYDWVDLNNEGVSGILSQQAGEWFYKRNLGSARFAPLQSLVRKPALANIGIGADSEFIDLAGDGEIDLVRYAQPLPGYFERSNEEDWSVFTPFASYPNIDWKDPNLRFIDLNGDGHNDVLISGDHAFVWYPSLAEGGFGAIQQLVPKSTDEEKGPTIVFADATESIFLADMSGDGLTDIVRIRNGEICYWSNVGYGKFAPKVTMSRCPVFDYPERFDPRRIRLADIDGSGTTDIIYLGSNEITLWFNEAGNGWSEPHQLTDFPSTENLSSVNVVDLFGNGTACIVWSSALPASASHPMQYIDLMVGVKPHLLKSMNNNMGAEVRVHYASSTKFYLQDLAEEKPWITKLPFPVQVVERVETYDRISRNKLVTLYSYHHGFYDGVEREFRGFGRVDQWDTEFFEDFQKESLFNEPVDNNEAPFQLPPIYTRTWFHTGAYLAGEKISRHFESEYYGAPEMILLPDTELPPDLRIQEEREACRALKGMMLRQEVYSLDGSLKSEHPYTVVETAYQLRLMQPLLKNKYAVFYGYQSEAIHSQYERNPVDPRISHELNLDVDEFGSVTRSATLGYRRLNAAMPEQEKTFVTYTENQFIHIYKEEDRYYIGLPSQTATYEITGILQNQDVPFPLEPLKKAIGEATEIPYEQSPNLAIAQKRLIELVRVLYYDDQLMGPLPLNQVGHLPLSYETYKMAFTAELVTMVYGGRATDDILRQEARYIKAFDYKNPIMLFPETDQDGSWWIRSGRHVYAPSVPNPLGFASENFFLPVFLTDPFERTLEIVYDNYKLLLQQTIDPLGNITQAQNHYRVLQPWMIIDPNGNRSALRFDELGLVVSTAISGKANQNEGDSLDENTIEVSAIDDPTTTLEYDLFQNFIDPDHHRPNFVHTSIREQHGNANTHWQQSFTYSDGFGREVMTKMQTESGLAPARDSNGQLLHDDNGKLILQQTSSRWVGTGRTIFNNKGDPVKKYEPFFDTGPYYTDEKELVECGVSSVLSYDPLSRLVRTDRPDGVFSKVEFDSWSQNLWDENDTVLESMWFALRKDGQFGVDDQDKLAEEEAATKTAAHSGTFTVTHFDGLGRPFITIADNAIFGKYETRIELDIEGNQRSVTDPLNRVVMKYDYDLLGTRIHGTSMDAGERWMLNNVAGNSIRIWDAPENDPAAQEIRTLYDELQRATHILVSKGDSLPILAERTVYVDHPDSGMTVEESKAANLRLKPFHQYDAAGVITNEQYDFKGNLLVSTRRLAKEYKQQIDWSPIADLTAVDQIENAAEPFLQTETFLSSVLYDALNRAVQLITPHSNTILPNVIQPTFNEANLLETVNVWLRQDSPPQNLLDPAGADFHAVANIDYNEKGQRTLIAYGTNGVVTHYEYDEKNFRLRRVLTNRSNGSETLQDLRYTYDPVGNITHIQDNADIQNTIYFANQRVEPSADYLYDAIYRLISAEGREHLGQTNQQPSLPTAPDAFNSFHSNLHHPGDGNAMGIYVENYTYDEAGNLTEIHHTGFNPASSGWIRSYTYSTSNNRLSNSTLHPDGSQPLIESYEYDNHGNMISMPHLPVMRWNFKDELQATSQQVNNSGTPEITYYVYNASGERLRKVTERQAQQDQTPTRRNERIYLGGFEIYREFDGDGQTITLQRETVQVSDDQNQIALVETKTVDTSTPSFTPSPFIRFQLSNHLGSATLELDENGEVISYEEYYPYGSTSYQAVRKDIKVPPKRYRFIGKERDDETGFYYHGARYYAPWLGRWISPDPAGLVDGPNVWCYSANNPITNLDNTGNQHRSATSYEERMAAQGGLNLLHTPVSGKYAEGIEAVEALPKPPPKPHKAAPTKAREYGMAERLWATPVAEVELGGQVQLMTLETAEFLQQAGLLQGAKVTFRKAGLSNEEIEAVIAESEKLHAEAAARIALFERDAAKIEDAVAPYLPETREIAHGAPMDPPSHGARMLPLQGPYSVSETATPLGFRSYAEWSHFAGIVRQELARRGVEGQIIIGGSSVTGHGFERGAPFDYRRKSDFDLGIVNPELLQRARQTRGLSLRASSTKSGALTPRDEARLGLGGLSRQVSQAVEGRKVSFMIFRDMNVARTRGPRIVAPTR